MSRMGAMAAMTRAMRSVGVTSSFLISAFGRPISMSRASRFSMVPSDRMPSASECVNVRTSPALLTRFVPT